MISRLPHLKMFLRQSISPAQEGREKNTIPLLQQGKESDGENEENEENDEIPLQRERKYAYSGETTLLPGRYYYFWSSGAEKEKREKSRHPESLLIKTGVSRLKISAGKVRKEGRFLSAGPVRTWALPKEMGHRGDGAGQNENTLESVRRAWQKGARMVEVDVQLHQGSLWVEHDSLEVSPEKERLLLRRLLREAPEDLGFNLELKVFPEETKIIKETKIIETFTDSPLYHAISLVSLVTQEVAQAQTWPRRNIIYSSFHPQVCSLALAMQQEYFVFLLAEGVSRGDTLAALRQAGGLGVQGVALRALALLGGSGEVLAAAESEGLEIIVWGEETNEREVKNFCNHKDISVITDILGNV